MTEREDTEKAAASAAAEPGSPNGETVGGGPPPRESRLRRLIVFLAIMAVVGFVLNLLVDNPYTHRLIRAVVNEKVEENTNLTVDFKALKVNLLPPGIDLYGISVATNVRKDRPLASASHARARISLWALFLGEVKLATVEADDLGVIWPPPWGFKGFLKEPAHGPPQKDGPVRWPPDGQLPVERVRLTNAKVYAELPTEDRVPMSPHAVFISAVGIDLDAQIESLNDIDLSLGVKSANVAIDAASFLEETAITIDAELVMGKIRARTVRIDGERLSLDGRVDGELVAEGKNRILQKLTLAVRGEVEGDLSLLGTFLDVSDTRGPVKGTVAVDAEVPIEAEGAPTYLIKADGRVQDGRLRGFRLFDSHALVEVRPDGVTFPQIELIQGETKIADVTGTIKFNDAMNFDFRGNPRGLRLLDLLDALGVGFDLMDLTLDTPDLRVWGSAFPFALNVQATAQASEIVVPLITFDQSTFPVSPSCRLDLRLGITDVGVDFGGTHGNCFQMATSARLDTPLPGQLSPPPGAAAASPVEASGGVFFDPRSAIDLMIRSDSFDVSLGQHFAQQPLAGDAKLQTQIHGPFTAVRIDNEIKVRNFAAKGLPFGNVEGKASVVGDELRWTGVQADLGGPGRLMAPNGKLMISADKTFETRLAAHGIDQASIRRFFAQVAPSLDLGFALEGLDGQIRGPLLFPGAYQGTLAVRVRDLTMGPEKLADSFFATIRSDQKGVAIDDLTASLGDLSLTGRASHKRAFPFSREEAEGSADPWARFGLHPDDKFDLEIATVEGNTAYPEERTRAATADHLGVLPFAGTKLREVGIRGLISLNGKFTGSPGHLSGALAGQLQRPSVFGSQMATVNLKGFVKDGAIDVVVDQGGSALEGRISLDVMKPGVPYEWFFSLNRMDLRAFLTDFFHSDPRNYAYLTAAWRMRGELTDWWRSTGELDVKDLRAKFVRDVGSQTKALAIRQEHPVRLTFAKDGWRFEDQRDLYLSGRNVQMRVSMGDNAPPEKLGIKMEGVIDVGLLKDFSQQVETASGKLRVIAEVKGSVAAPQFSLELTDLKPNPFIAATWSPLSLGLADIRPALRNIRLRVLLQDGRLVIDSFAADKGSGSVTASGAFALGQGGDESRLDVVMNSATVSYPVAFLKSAEAELTGSVSLTGKGVPYRVTGDIEVVRARSTSEVDIRDEIINALRSQSFTAALKSDQPVVVLDLNITADQSVNIHNRNLQALMSADLVIKGTDVTPSISGQIEIDKGKFIYKRDFQITRGLVIFDDPVKPDPTLDLLAVSEVDSYRVFISLTGRASNPTVEFSVDPPVREDGTAISKVEILVLLSRGKLPEANRSVGQSTQSAATSEAINLIMGQFEEPVEKLFELSGQNVVRNVYIDTHPSQNGDPVPRFNLPLDLGEDFDVVVRVDQTSEEAAAEYDVHENIKVLGTLERQRDQATTETTDGAKTPAGDAKVNLKFRFSFD